MEGITASAGPTGQLTSEYRFWAFISYSQHDGRWAKWLHRRLETYRVPALLVGKDHWSGKIPARLFPVFRDRDELPSAADLGDQVHEALKRSRVLIVICSPHAARSRWVNQEIKLFKSLGREKQVFAVIVNGEPGDRRLGTACEECFPEALGHQYDCDQQPMEKKVEPIAADVREGKDGRTNAVLKLVAGILDVSYDQLKRREQERRIRWLMKFGAAMAALVVLFAGLAYYAQGQKTLARSNERLARSAENQALEAAKAERSARGMAEEQRVLADQRRAEAEAARSLAEERQRQALLRLAELYQEQGGQALLAGDQLKALVYFGESYRMGNHSAAQRLLLGESMRTLDSEKLLLRHESSVDSLSFSHNGKLLITGSADGRATIWNSLTGSVLTRLQTHVREGPKNVWQVAFKADDAGVFTATANSPPEVWDARNGQHQETLEEHSRVSLNGFGSASPFAFTLDGVLFAETTVSNEILLRNARTNHILYTLKGHTDRIGNIAFSADGKFLASTSRDKTARVWDVTKGQLVATIEGQTERSNAVALSPRGDRVVTFSSEHAGQVWQVSDRKLVATLRGHRDDVTTVRFTADGTHIATGSLDCTVRFWEADTGVQLMNMEGHTGWILALAVSPEGALVASASSDQTVRIWDIAQSRMTVRLNVGSEVGFPGFSPDGLYAFSDSWPETKLWNVRERRLIGSFKGQVEAGYAPANTRAFSPDGTRILLAHDRALSMLDMESQRPLFTLGSTHDFFCEGSFSPDGKRFVAANLTGFATIRDAASGKILFELNDGLKRETSSARFSNDGTRVIVLGSLRVSVWDSATGKLLASRNVPLRNPFTAALSPDGARVVSMEETVRVWDAKSGRVQWEFEGHAGGAKRCAFSPDSARLVTSGAQDGVAKVWDLHTGRALLTLEHSRPRTGLTTPGVNSAEFSADGMFVVTAGDDRLSKIWDATRGTLLLTLEGHQNDVIGASFAPSGNAIITVGRDSTTRLWSLRINTQPAEAITSAIRQRVPLRLENGRLVFPEPGKDVYVQIF